MRQLDCIFQVNHVVENESIELCRKWNRVKAKINELNEADLIEQSYKLINR